MKLRIQGTSLRLRLSEAEVSQFGETGQVEETVVFGPDAENVLRYRLCTTDSPCISVIFSDKTITVNIPGKLAYNWVTTDLIGLEDAVPTLNGSQLKVLIEKDLSCHHRPAN